MDHPLGHYLTLGVDDPLLNDLPGLVDNQLSATAHDVGRVDLNDLLVGGVNDDLLTALRVQHDLPARQAALYQLALGVDDDLLTSSRHNLPRGLNDLLLLGLLDHSRLGLDDGGLTHSVLQWRAGRLLLARLLGSRGLGRSQLQWERTLPDLNTGVVILHLLPDLLLVRTGAAAEQSPDAESIVLGGDHLLPAHPVHAGQVLLVHDVLLDGLARGWFVSGF